jgi:copper(I)-binding protein
MRLKKLFLLAATGIAMSCANAAPVDVQNPWVHSTVPGQKSSAAFMTISAQTGVKLVSVSTPVASFSAVHEMHMEGDIMKMNEVDALDIPSGKSVSLAPGGLHIMLMDLKDQMKVGGSVPIDLTFLDANGKKINVHLSAPVESSPPHVHTHMH